jgi:hypothetical protein
MKRLAGVRPGWVAAALVLLALSSSFALHRATRASPGPGEVRVTGTIVNRISGSRWCDTRTAHVTFILNGSDKQGSTHVYACSGVQQGDHIPLIVRTRDGHVVSGGRPLPFAAEVGIAAFLLLGIAVCAAWAVRRHLVNGLIRSTARGSNEGM